MSKAAGERYTVAVDFDGVLHSYTSPWVNAETIPDPPVPGAIEWLREIAKAFTVVIFTTRGKTPEGQRAVRHWLHENGWDAGINATVTADKPPALIYLDDRAWRFIGYFPTANEIHEARPWNKIKSDIASKGPRLDSQRATVEGVAVHVERLPDDPSGLLRASLGGDPALGYYLTYRGEADAVRHLLETALVAFSRSA